MIIIEIPEWVVNSTFIFMFVWTGLHIRTEFYRKKLFIEQKKAVDMGMKQIDDVIKEADKKFKRKRKSAKK